MRVLACLLFALAACKTTHSAEQHATDEIQSLSDKEGRSTVTQTVTTGPETITTTVEEFEGGRSTGLGAPLIASPTQAREPGPLSVSVAPAVPHTGQLIRRITTIDQRGPSLAETHTEASTASQVKRDEHKASEAATSSTSKPAAGCMLGLGFWAAIALVVLMGAAAIYLRLKP